jgi:hypothetical protein
MAMRDIRAAIDGSRYKSNVGPILCEQKDMSSVAMAYHTRRKQISSLLLAPDNPKKHQLAGKISLCSHRQPIANEAALSSVIVARDIKPYVPMPRLQP